VFPLTASMIEVMHVLGLSVTTVSVYRSPGTMATISALAKPLGFWLDQMPISVCTLSMCMIMHQMVSLLTNIKLSLYIRSRLPNSLPIVHWVEDTL